MIIYKIGHFWNFYSFPDCQILQNLLIFEIVQIQKFDYFMNLSITEI